MVCNWPVPDGCTNGSASPHVVRSIGGPGSRHEKGPQVVGWRRGNRRKRRLQSFYHDGRTGAGNQEGRRPGNVSHPFRVSWLPKTPSMGGERTRPSPAAQLWVTTSAGAGPSIDDQARLQDRSCTRARRRRTLRQGQRGHRSRSSSTSFATSTLGRSLAAAVGFATRSRPMRTSFGPGIDRSSRTEPSSTTRSSSVPGLSPSCSRTRTGISTRPAQSMEVFMTREYQLRAVDFHSAFRQHLRP